MKEKAKERAEKVRWMLENKGKAKSRGQILIAKAKEMQYTTNAKVAVGGSGQGGKSDSEQERHLLDKADAMETGERLSRIAKAIETDVRELSKAKRTIIIQKTIFDGLTDKLARTRLESKPHPNTVRRIRNRAIDELIDSGLLTLYDDLKQLLEKTEGLGRW